MQPIGDEELVLEATQMQASAMNFKKNNSPKFSFFDILRYH